MRLKAVAIDGQSEPVDKLWLRRKKQGRFATYVGNRPCLLRVTFCRRSEMRLTVFLLRSSGLAKVDIIHYWL